MPTVPTIQTRQVQQNQISSPRLNVQTPTFSSARTEVSNLGRATEQFIGNAVKIENEEIRKANQLAVLEADQKLSSIETSLLFDRNTGAMNIKGKDSFSLPDSVFGAYDKQSEEILNSLANDDQKNALRRRIISRRSDIDVQLQRHIFREGQKYDQDLTNSYVENEKNAAIENFFDSNRVSVSLERQREAIIGHAERNGLPNEWVKMKTKDVESKTHVGVLSRIIDGGEDIKARDYYDKYKDRISGPDQSRIERAIMEVSIRGESQRQADSIWESSEYDLSSSFTKAEKTVKDPKVRDEVIRRLKQKKYFYDMQLKREQEMRFSEATEYVKSQSGIDPRDAMPPSLWESLTLQQQSSLRKYNQDPVTNERKWLDFYSKSPKELSEMTQEEFEQKYWSYFSSSDRKRAEKMFSDVKDGVDSAKVSNTLTFKQRVDNTLRISGFIDKDRPVSKLNDNERHVYVTFQQEASKRIEEYELSELSGKRKATGQEMQSIIDKMASEKVFIDRNWLFSDPEVPASTVSKDEKGSVYVPYEKIPQEEINAIENYIVSKGYKLKRDKVEKAWAARLMRDPSLVESVIKD